MDNDELIGKLEAIIEELEKGNRDDGEALLYSLFDEMEFLTEDFNEEDDEDEDFDDEE